MPSRISAVILAAGLSRRMGNEDKLFLPYKGSSIIGHVIDQVGASQVFEVIVVTSPLLKTQVGQLKDHSSRAFTTVINDDFQEGMTTSIQQGVRSCAGESEGWMICLGDMPETSTAEYDYILDQYSIAHSADPKVIAVPYYLEKKGNPIVFSTAYRPGILTNPYREGCKQIVQTHHAHVVKVHMDTDHVLTDIDTKEDYRRLS